MPKITVYCDRVGKVEEKGGMINCPKCGGVATWQSNKNLFDCGTCGRGWEIVPNEVVTDHDAEEYLTRSYENTHGEQS